jgi:hypothetical protein
LNIHLLHGLSSVAGLINRLDITQAFIPYLASVHGHTPYVDEIAVLLMDSASPHVSDRILRFLGENWGRAVVFPAQTSNVLQVLDLAFLAL